MLALDMGRMTDVVALDERVRDGDRAGRHQGARARAPTRRARAHARPLPAVLRVRLARRLRGDALGRAGIDRLRRDREDGAGPALAAPASEIALPALPASAAGPGLRQLLVGSEGALGVICELALRVRPAPHERIYEGVFFEDFAAGAQTLRALAREHALPDVARLSDEQETRMSLALAGSGGIKGRLGRGYLQLRGYRERLPGDPRLRGWGRGGRSTPPACAARSCAASAGSPSGARLARHGRRAASPLRTCATSCSRTG